RLAQNTAAATGLPLPTVLANTSVRVLNTNGVEQLASLLYVSPSQINLIIPQQIPNTGYLILNVDNGSGPLIEGARATPVQAVAAGLFTADGTGHGLAAASAVRVQGDG